MPRFAQAKENVRRPAPEVPAAALAEAERAQRRAAGSGRVLVRASGTEPLDPRARQRPKTEEEAQDLCGSIADLVRRELG